MISSLELRHIIEQAFLPMKCICINVPDGSLTIQIFSQNTEKEELTVTGVDASGLGSSRAIAALVLELRDELKHRHLSPGQRERAYKG
ncbi:DUF1652 domain-containing protein [Pseudomonas amygdali pv. lachrymans]|uniref:DUF1652 domain-containing protein n=1 Tax=Pseudomonas amygdali pv. lachrymans str. M301315 TaxID=629260 RepID=A0AAD0LWX9_PSEAV|nr:DUF1652 domain-containing protein [Pseudomonas amygdali]AXH55462.1 DUF1652 domain-containing protein [Pseudomonas amygdali pv. lachrymans str. M301315]AXH56282.1 DUF1652 domain-containing protein [Pseudomonas amygdali pv. lachrymans str. M301315]PWC98719.1 DUF1652 domain-containing protein [Pseudomonas amygdali pv. lachrymans]PWC99990.1 DUF1652 domain-containing protein [Pseudomonas amygdali pv. lachrymans]PWD04108.1 DUF1652 domain-containing protein [Pseudomonas amygdali pv. lachrymans]